jgi:hypothetical protein
VRCVCDFGALDARCDWERAVAAALVDDVPKRGDDGYEFLDDFVQVCVVRRMQIVDVRVYLRILSVRETDVAGELLEARGPEGLFLLPDFSLTAMVFVVFITRCKGWTWNDHASAYTAETILDGDGSVWKDA